MDLVICFQGTEQGKGTMVTFWWRSLEKPCSQAMKGNTTGDAVWMPPPIPHRER